MQKEHKIISADGVEFTMTNHGMIVKSVGAEQATFISFEQWHEIYWFFQSILNIPE